MIDAEALGHRENFFIFGKAENKSTSASPRLCVKTFLILMFKQWTHAREKKHQH